MKDCIFCKVVNDELPSTKIYENDNFIAVYDVAPQVEHHVVVISKKHFKDILEMPGSLGAELMECVKATSLKLIKEYGYGGFNIVVNTGKSAGQVIDHFHLHILPRKEGDGYSLSVKGGN